MSSFRKYANKIVDIKRLNRAYNIKISKKTGDILKLLTQERMEQIGHMYLNDKLLESFSNSIETLVRTMKEQPSDIDKKLMEINQLKGNIRTSASLLKSIYKNFCSIPPFCDREEELER